jgi:ribosomal-protein-alanine acetyltransferase
MSQMSVKIQRASIKHLDKLYEIEIECFDKEAFAKQQIAHLLTDHDSTGLIAELNDEIAGFVIGKTHRKWKSTTGHILTINVSPKHRRKGIGLRLLQEIERIFKNKGVKVCFLEAREDNTAALNLYQRFGYEEVGRFENYYGNSHAVRLKKMLA